MRKTRSQTQAEKTHGPGSSGNSTTYNSRSTSNSINATLVSDRQVDENCFRAGVAQKRIAPLPVVDSNKLRVSKYYSGAV